MNKTFTISVDVEDFFPNRNHPDSYFGKVKTNYWGITKIMDICERFGHRVTFFVDVHNTENYVSKDTISMACKLISSRGHEVALHTHPSKRLQANFEQDRILSNYDFDYQYDYIIKNAKKIEEWTGVWPISHRAGSYGANYDTIKALHKAHILVDSSIFWDRRDFSFVPNRDYNNIHPFKLKGLIELPVTSYNLNLGLGQLPFKLKINKKTDIEWCSVFEFKKFIDRSNPGHVDIFMHSYSLIDIRKWQPNLYAVSNLVNFLKILRKDYTNVLFRDFLDIDLLPKLSKPQINMELSKIGFNDYKNIYFPKFTLSSLSSILQI